LLGHRIEVHDLVCWFELKPRGKPDLSVLVDDYAMRKRIRSRCVPGFELSAGDVQMTQARAQRIGEPTIAFRVPRHGMRKRFLKRDVPRVIGHVYRCW